MSILTDSSLKQLQQAVAEMQQMEAALALSHYQCSEVIKQMQQVRKAFRAPFTAASYLAPPAPSIFDTALLKSDCSHPSKNK
ncbi:hypothetical protein KCM76_15655 [Zooshikella marina]|uniref:Uncharacterized protein n=1 Tax=Zooshikella ganghwensis TaxID=202772 RepID=A0A4P9VRX0_9GAMM|nr:hypothetical protein [Zooshikella ganghwensis]MBU2707428.1 hypothetical protein [Zooshikella ganghwensis]RDH45539.1 hypothetical protein B9G39_19945 [Zooshikella ganghwensis]